MTDTQNPDLDEGFPSNAPEQPTKRVAAKPFGHDKQAALVMKAEALATMSRQEAFDKGFLTVKDLDDEELVHGRCRDENGYIPKRGKKTHLIPDHLYDAMVAEHELRFRQKLRQNLDKALDYITDLIDDDTAEPKERFEAAKYVFERTAGKTPDQVSVTVKQAPWEGVLTDITGIGAISRAEHRKLHGAGVIDVEVVDDDDIQPESIQVTSEGVTKQGLVSVHNPRPDDRGAEPQQAEAMGQDTDDDQEQPVEVPPAYQKHVDGEPTFERDPAQPRPGAELPAPVPVDPPDPTLAYGSRRTEAKTYADQVRAAEDLAARRKATRERIQGAKKARKIARATGADAIETDITGASLSEDGRLTFE